MTNISPKSAVALWKGGANTSEIAQALGCEEWWIYNNLPRWRHLSKQWPNVPNLPPPTLTTRNKNRVPTEMEADYRYLREKKRDLSAPEVAQILKLI